MFRNLEAEQARRGHNNVDAAKFLGLSRNTYESKKKTGKFTRSEIVALMQAYDCSFEYLMEWTQSDLCDLAVSDQTA